MFLQQASYTPSFGGLGLSTGKQSFPGPKQVYRYHDKKGDYLQDVITLATEPPPEVGGEPLLTDVMRGGRILKEHRPLDELRETFAREFARLSKAHKALRSPAAYDVRNSAGVAELRASVEAETRER